MRQLSYRLILLLIPVTTVAPPLPAQKKVSYDGYVSAGGRVEYEGFGESFYRAKVQLEVKINDFVEAQVDIRGRSDRREIELREISGKFKYWERTRLEMGNLKRTFGLEEMTSRERLYTVERSLINRHLSPMGYVGRHLTLQLYQKTKEKESPYSYFFSVSYNESRTPGANIRLSLHEVGGLSVIGFDAVYQRVRGEFIFGDPVHVFALSADVSKKTHRSYADAEIFFGKDPLETRIGRFTGNERSVYFLGVKTLQSHRFQLRTKGLSGIEPVLLLSLLAPDTRDFDFNQFQVLVGLNLYFDEDVRLLVNGDLVSSNSRFVTNDRDLFGSNVVMELQFRW